MTTNTTTSTSGKVNGKTAPTAPAAAPKAIEADEYSDFVEYQAVGSLTADGFWNIPQAAADAAKVVGESLDGFLLAEVRTKKDGKVIEAPFYIFELTKDHSRISDTGENKGKIISLKAGQKVGVSAGWVDLQNLIRLKGHRFHITFLGKEPVGLGRTKNNFSVKYAKTAERHIEDVASAKMDEGDKGGAGEEVPFG